jgi:hypothetical protein
MNGLGGRFEIGATSIKRLQDEAATEPTVFGVLSA